MFINFIKKNKYNFRKLDKCKFNVNFLNYKKIQGASTDLKIIQNNQIKNSNVNRN